MKVILPARFIFAVFILLNCIFKILNTLVVNMQYASCLFCWTSDQWRGAMIIFFKVLECMFLSLHVHFLKDWFNYIGFTVVPQSGYSMK